MNINYEELGERIRQFRKSKNMTQEQLAEKTGLSHVQIGNIESARSRPSVESLANISSALEISTDQLLFGCVRFSEDQYYTEYSDIIKNCNDKEKHIITETIRTLSNELHKPD